MNYFIEQVYVVKEQATTIVIQKNIMDAFYAESKFLRSEIASKDNQINLHLLQVEHCKGDYKYVENQLVKATRSKRLFKTGFIIVGSVAVVELGVIGVMRLVK